MRHLRVPNQNLANLSMFKRQIGSILRKINDFDEADKTEALTYLKECIDADAGTSKSSTKPESAATEGPLKKRKRRLIEFSKDCALECNKQRANKTTKRPKSRYRQQKFDDVKPIVLKCKVCNATKRTKRLLLKHLETHVGTPISCAQCKRAFNSRLSYDWHLVHFCKSNKTTREKRFKCTECATKFVYKRNLDRHLEGHKRNNCTYCDTVLTKRKQLVRHLLEVHAIKLESAVHKCDHCEKRFVKKRSLFYHMQQHVTDKFICMECGVISSSLVEHTEHASKHDEKKPFKCPRCNDRFSRRQQYLFHIKRHDRYKCVTCNETFASKACVVRHKQRGHQVEGLHPTMACPYCPAAFHRKLTLQMHMRKHSEIKPTINCKYCDKTFQSPYTYYKHCMTANHEKQSPETSKLVCESCGKQFTKKYLLEQHVSRAHGLEKEPHRCAYCEYKTHNKTNMKRHVTLHLSQEKEFVCDQCGKTFSSNTSLKDHVSHMHTYSQEKNFKCEECEKSFKRNSDLVRHRATHSNVRPFVCTTCNTSYKRSTHLRRHEESAHKNVTQKKRVQRLKVDKNGDLVPVPVEKKTKDNIKTQVNVPSTFLTQPIEYFARNEDHTVYNQPNYWNGKFALSNTAGVPSSQSNELVALNIVDQLVNSFIPDKVMNVNQNNYYDGYGDPTVHYGDVALSTEATSDDILTTTEKILQDQSGRDFIMEQNGYVSNYQFMQ